MKLHLFFVLVAACCSTPIQAQTNLMLLRTNPYSLNALVEVGAEVASYDDWDDDGIWGPAGDYFNSTVHAYASDANGTAEATGICEATSSTAYNQLNASPFVNSFSGILVSAHTPPGGGYASSGAASYAYSENQLTVQPVSGVSKGLLKGHISVHRSDAQYPVLNYGFASVSGVRVETEEDEVHGPVVRVYVGGTNVHTAYGAFGATVQFEQVVAANTSFLMQSDSATHGSAGFYPVHIDQCSTVAAVEVEAIESGNPPLGVTSVLLWLDDEEEPVELIE